ncbi:NUDIX hydrolase [Bartonella sp. LJL80]
MKFTVAPSHSVQAVSVVCRRDGLFLLIERAKPAYKNWLAFPGGRIEPGELPEHAARRELMEETHLKAGELSHLVTLDLAKNHGQQARFYLSVYHALSFQGEALADDDAAGVFWLSLDEMTQYRVIPSVVDVARQLVQNESPV